MKTTAAISAEQDLSFFEGTYTQLREIEGRICTDEELRLLPRVKETGPNKKEWAIRERSAKRLFKYFSHQQRPLTILEVGCGNGWLSHYLSKVRQAKVTGIDINSLELRQAQRVFGDVTNLSFLYGTLEGDAVTAEKFDHIVFAASIQYFPSVAEVIEIAFDYLKEKGEVHIIDTHFYADAAVHQARARSRAYFGSKGFDRMNDHYFHHAQASLTRFAPVFLYDPASIVNKIFRDPGPFPWICIKK